MSKNNSCFTSLCGTSISLQVSRISTSTRWTGFNGAGPGLAQGYETQDKKGNNLKIKPDRQTHTKTNITATLAKHKNYITYSSHKLLGVQQLDILVPASCKPRRWFCFSRNNEKVNSKNITGLLKQKKTSKSICKQLHFSY